MSGASWQFEPWLDPAVIAVATTVLLAATAIRLAKEMLAGRPAIAWLSAGLRTLTIGLCAAVLLNPVRQITRPADAPGQLLVMLDASASMQQPAGRDVADPSPLSRYGFARQVWLTPQRLAELGEDRQVRVVSFGDRLSTTLPDTPEAEQTRLLSAVEESLPLLRTGGGDPPQGGSAVLILSDGNDRSGRDVAAIARAASHQGTAVHTVTFGQADRRPTLQLLATPHPALWMVGEVGRIDIELRGQHADGLELTVRLDGPDPPAPRHVVMPARGSTRLAFDVRLDQPGLYRYEISVEGPKEFSDASQVRQPVWVRVTDQRTRVLLLEGQPFWDTTFLSRSLRADHRLRLDQVLRVGPERTAVGRTDEDDPGLPGSPAVPQTLEQWRRYDVVVLGRGLADWLSPPQIASLTQWVEQGGRLVWARGPIADRESSPWSGVSIGRWDGRWQDGPAAWWPSERAGSIEAFARLGGDSGATFERFAEVSDLPPTTQIWARAQRSDRPEAIVALPRDRGLIVSFLGEGWWRWSLQAARAGGSSETFDAFWSTLLRGLVSPEAVWSRGEGPSLWLETHNLELGQTLVYSAANDSAGPPLTLRIEDPDGEATSVALDWSGTTRRRAEGRWTPTAAGEYELRLEDDAGQELATAPLRVYDGSAERTLVQPNAELMSELARLSGGRVLEPGDPDAINRWLSTQRISREVPGRTQPAWDRPEFWLSFLLLLGGEWIVRRRGGLR